MQPLRIRVLGKLKVTRDGTPIELPQSRKTRALLAYLALTERPHSRERLVSMFWDVPDDPRGALRWSLSKLRAVLDDRERIRVRADRETVALDLADASIDLARIRALAGPDPATAATEALETAIEAFKGELLAGLDLPNQHEFQFWLVGMREDARALKARIDRELVERFAEDPLRALAHARALVDYDPYDEAAQTALVTALAQAGRRAEAEEQYRRALMDLEEAGGAGAGLREAWRTLGPSRSRSARSARSQLAAAQPAAAPAAAVAPVPAERRCAPMPAHLAETETILSRPAVAVLPFENLGSDPGQEYLADGVTDEVITALSQWRWFPVIARTSTLAYRGRHVSAGQVGRELGARYVVQGSVRQAGGRVRAVVQLVDAESGLTIWANRYDSDLGDVFDLQDEIARQIVTGIEPELARAERRRTERRPDQRLGVWELNLRAFHHIDRGTAEDLEQARAALDRSLELEPASSYTLSLVAYCMYHQALLVWTTRDPEELARSYLDTAKRAVALDERNWLAHALLGMSVLWSHRDYAAAESEELRAIELNPTAPLAHQFVGCIYNFNGQPGDAIPHLQASLRLNPGPSSATLLLADLALAHMLEGDLDQAVSHARRAISKFSGNVRAWERLAAALGLQNRVDEARSTMREMIRLHGEPGPAYLTLTYPFRTDEHRAVLMDGLAAAGLRG